MRQIPLPMDLRPARTFDNLVTGANAAAIAHLRELDATAAPVYLWGPSGSGKSHLLQALVDRFEAHGHRAAWFGPADAAPWSHDARWSLVVIDDCDRLDAAQQHAAFSLFLEASALGTPLAAAGRVPPVDLPLREDLRSRLGWGHVFALQPLAEAEVRAALRREADQRGILFSDEVMDYLMTRFARDLKHLIRLLDRLDTYSMSTQRGVTVPLLKRMLAEDDA